MFDILLDDFVLISIVPEKTFQVFLLLNSALASLFQPQEAHKGIFQKKKKKGKSVLFTIIIYLQH